MGQDGMVVGNYRTSKQLLRRRVAVGMNRREVAKRLARIRRSKNMARDRRKLTRLSLSHRPKSVNLVKVIDGSLCTDRVEWRADATRWGREKYGSASNSRFEIPERPKPTPNKKIKQSKNNGVFFFVGLLGWPKCVDKIMCRQMRLHNAFA